MANVRGSEPVVEKIVPSSHWTQDSNGHYLHVYLPEFKKEQVQIQINSVSGHVKVSGERTTNQNKQVRFDETYKVPAEKLDWDKIRAIFDGEFLHVNLPKQVDTVVEKKRVDDDKKQVETELEKQRDDSIVKKCLEDEEGYLRSAMKKLSQSKEIIVIAILVCSLGVLLSRSFQPPERH